MLSVSQAEKLLGAAIARLSRGDGRGKLADLGIQGAQLVRDAGVSKGVFYRSEFRDRGDGNAVAGMVEAVLERLLSEQESVRETAVENYSAQAGSIAEGAGRGTIASALLKELRRYGAIPDESTDLDRARERVYYLAIALCDSGESRDDNAIDSSKAAPDLRFRQHLLDVHGANRDALIEVYREYLRVARREPIGGAERIERVIGSFIEGALIFRRIGSSHPKVGGAGNKASPAALMLDDDDLVDAVLRLFVAMSYPAGGEPLDPDAVLFRRGDLPPRASPEATLHIDADVLYADLIDLIDDLDKGCDLAHCSFYSAGISRVQPRRAEKMNEAIARFAARGGCLRNMEKISSVAELESTVVRLREQIEAGQEVHFRALLFDAPPSLAPLLIGERASFLIRQEGGRLLDAMGFVDDVGRDWCKSHYEALWADERGVTLASPDGINGHRVADARMRLEALERNREAEGGGRPK
jgi:hypothetical protein